MRRLALVVLAILAITLGYGCKKNPAAPSGQNNTFTGTVTPSAPDSTHIITVTKTGTMTVTLTWPSGTNDLDLYVTNSSCTDPGSCSFSRTSDSSSGTSEEISFSVTSGDTYKAWADLYDGSTSTYTIKVSIP